MRQSSTIQYRVNEHETREYWDFKRNVRSTCITINCSVVRPLFSRVGCSTSSAVDLRWSSKIVSVVFAFGLLSISSGMTSKTPHEQPFFTAARCVQFSKKYHYISASRFPDSGTIALACLPRLIRRPTTLISNDLSPQTSTWTVLLPTWESSASADA